MRPARCPRRRPCPNRPADGRQLGSRPADRGPGSTRRSGRDRISALRRVGSVRLPDAGRTPGPVRLRAGPRSARNNLPPRAAPSPPPAGASLRPASFPSSADTHLSLPLLPGLPRLSGQTSGWIPAKPALCPDCPACPVKLCIVLSRPSPFARITPLVRANPRPCGVAPSPLPGLPRLSGQTACRRVAGLSIYPDYRACPGSSSTGIPLAPSSARISPLVRALWRK